MMHFGDVDAIQAIIEAMKRRRLFDDPYEFMYEEKSVTVPKLARLNILAFVEFHLVSLDLRPYREFLPLAIERFTRIIVFDRFGTALMDLDPPPLDKSVLKPKPFYGASVLDEIRERKLESFACSFLAITGDDHGGIDSRRLFFHRKRGLQMPLLAEPTAQALTE